MRVLGVTAEPHPLSIRYQDATLKVAVGSNLCVVIWRDTPSMDQLRTLGRLNRELDGVGVLNVIASGVPRFGEEILPELIRQTGRAPVQTVTQPTTTQTAGASHLIQAVWHCPSARPIGHVFSTTSHAPSPYPRPCHVPT